MRTATIALLMFVRSLGAADSTDVRVTVFMVNGDQIAGKLIQYVGGELIIEEAGHKRIAMEARHVRAIVIGSFRGDFRKGLWFGREGQPGRTPSRKPVMGSASQPAEKPDKPPIGPDRRSAKPNDKEAPAGDGGNSVKIDTIFTKMEAMDVSAMKSPVMAWALTSDLVKSAEASGKLDAVLKRMTDKARAAEKGSLERAKWFALLSHAHRTADRPVAVTLRREALEALEAVDDPTLARRLMPYDRRGKRRGLFR